MKKHKDIFRETVFVAFSYIWDQDKLHEIGGSKKYSRVFWFTNTWNWLELLADIIFVIMNTKTYLVLLMQA